MQLPIISDFPATAEIRARLSSLQAAIERAGLEAYVSFSPDNIAYLTNFANIVHERPFILIVPSHGTPIFLIPRLEIPHVEGRVIGTIDVVPYIEFPALSHGSWDIRFRQILSKFTRVGYESVCPAYILHEMPADAVCLDLIDDQRAVKSQYEVGRLAYNGQLVTDAHNKLLAEARVGKSLAEVASQYSKEVMARAIRDNPGLNMIATRLISVFHPASVSHDPHNFTDINMQMAKGGPHVSVINGTLNGYGAEVERTFFLKEVPEDAKRPYETMMAARELALKLTVPGEMMSRVDREVNALFVKAGYGDNLLHRAGHSMGITGHEAPFLAEGYDRIIEPWMCFTIEPGLYLRGIGGFRHSDTIITTGNGHAFLTGGPTDLSELTLDC
ncbi:aminopeptidase P family protein (plasmid) [Rhizobium sp. NIBRBAC000502774]|nr:aminopeptidase P family protein [Rhizobium sp. NIBRBAC000502774]